MNPYKKYKEVQVTSASPKDLIILLYEHAIKSAKKAKLSIKEGNIQQTHNSLVKSQDIIYELMGSLNPDAGDVSKNLYSLYEFVNYTLGQANMKKDLSLIDQAIELLSELKESWEQIDVASIQNNTQASLESIVG